MYSTVLRSRAYKNHAINGKWSETIAKIGKATSELRDRARENVADAKGDVEGCATEFRRNRMRNDEEMSKTVETEGYVGVLR